MVDRPGQGPALSVDQLTKRFGQRTAFEELSFEVGRGEVFGFLGPNGAGKTTTVRTLGTLLEIRKRVAIMPEAPGLYLRLSVLENLACFADLYEVAEPRQRVDRALVAVGLADRAHDACGTLSKGLRQRVALARALLSDPEVLVLDEPTASLDPAAAHEVHELIGGLRERGVTIFLTTHRLEEAERLCDRVAILSTRLLTIGRPSELREQLFSQALVVRLAAALPDAAAVFSGYPASEAGGPMGPRRTS